MKTQVNHPCKVFILRSKNEEAFCPTVLFVVPEQMNHGMLRISTKTHGVIPSDRSFSFNINMKNGQSRKLTLTLHANYPYELNSMRLIWRELVEHGDYLPIDERESHDFLNHNFLTQSERQVFERFI